MKPVMSYLRDLGYASVIYLDDVLLIEDSEIKYQESVQVTVEFKKLYIFVKKLSF